MDRKHIQQKTYRKEGDETEGLTNDATPFLSFIML